MLIQLPSIGEWVNPRDVIVVGIKQEMGIGEPPYPFRVNVVLTKGGYLLGATGKTQAEALRDKIADQVNAALYEERKRG